MIEKNLLVLNYMFGTKVSKSFLNSIIYSSSIVIRKLLNLDN